MLLELRRSQNFHSRRRKFCGQKMLLGRETLKEKLKPYLQTGEWGE